MISLFCVIAIVIIIIVIIIQKKKKRNNLQLQLLMLYKQTTYFGLRLCRFCNHRSVNVCSLSSQSLA